MIGTSTFLDLSMAVGDGQKETHLLGKKEHIWNIGVGLLKRAMLSGYGAAILKVIVFKGYYSLQSLNMNKA